jgi:glycosyltransferase involved in cell wall biosynthesis
VRGAADAGARGALRIALVVYRGNPYCGGQGVYVRHLASALRHLGHVVTVFSGQPYPELEAGIELVKIPSLDLYRDADPFRRPRLREIGRVVDVLEVATMLSGGFPEPRTFSIRVRDELRRRPGEFDIVHDDQSLGRGILDLKRDGLSVVASVHHPVSIDRALDLAAATTAVKRWALRRWYGFSAMQTSVARRLPVLVTVSQSAKRDIVTEMGIDPSRIAVVPVGVDTALWRPLPEIFRVPGRIMTTASADIPLKGLAVLLEALAKLRTERDDAHLVVIGKLKEESPVAALITRLGLDDAVEFVSGESDESLVRRYASSSVAVVPSLYEGFSLPAIEAMACAVPLVATDGGALPEVVGANNDSAVVVAAGDPHALFDALRRLLDDPPGAEALGARGRTRVTDRFTWDATAQATVQAYRCAVLTVDLDRLGVVAGTRLLDIGCGNGRHAFAAWKAGSGVVAVDASVAELGDVATMAGAMLVAGEVSAIDGGVLAGDALALPFADRSFDVIVASEIFEHILDDHAAMRECARVLRPDGVVALSVPRALPEAINWLLSWDYHHNPGGHIRIYRRRQLLARLSLAGLEQVHHEYRHGLHSPYWWLRCALGVNRPERRAVALYHRLLVWEIVRQPFVLRLAAKGLDPLIGKSLVVYLRHDASTPAGR